MSTISNTVQLTPQFPIPASWNFADLQERLGNIPAERIRLNPPPGYATEEDVLRIEADEGILCELEDGILVEKPMGWYESFLASLIATQINKYLESNDLGKVLGADGSLKFLPGKIKIPDVSFISWSRFPDEKLPRRPVPLLIPDLVVEVISETNTPGEMQEKLKLYFETGVHLVWYVDPGSRSAVVYTAVDKYDETLPTGEPTGELDGGQVLPGFKISVAWLFEQADRIGPQ